MTTRATHDTGQVTWRMRRYHGVEIWRPTVAAAVIDTFTRVLLTTKADLLTVLTSDGRYVRSSPLTWPATVACTVACIAFRRRRRRLELVRLRFRDKARAYAQLLAFVSVPAGRPSG